MTFLYFDALLFEFLWVYDLQRECEFHVNNGIIMSLQEIINAWQKIRTWQRVQSLVKIRTSRTNPIFRSLDVTSLEFPSSTS